jgi:serine/threonine protein kinase
MSKKKLRGRLYVSELVPRCNIENSYMDVALMANILRKTSPVVEVDDTFLLGLMEIKNVLKISDLEAAVHQTVSYMISAFAYSWHGALGRRDPLVALIVATNAVYRLTLSRAQNVPKGYDLTIEEASGVAEMEWVLSEYLTRYIRDFAWVQSSSVPLSSKEQSVNPLDWIPLNFGNSKWLPATQTPSFGFVFRTSGDELMRVQKQYWVEALSLARDSIYVVKHLSVLLFDEFRSSLQAIAILLREQARGEATGIKHPYVGILGGGCPLIVMHDVGPPLTKAIKSPEFRRRWAQSPDLRRAFFEDVGLSALNLPERVLLCHNDIRPPNITYDGDRFCLIDFDFACGFVRPAIGSAFAPELPTNFVGKILFNDVAQMMCFSVAQIALTIFMLSGPRAFALDRVTEATSVWTRERDASSEVDAEFDRWVRGRGGLALEFVEAFRGAVPWPPALAADPKRYFSEVLAELLV